MFSPCADRKERSGEGCDPLKPLLTQPVDVERSNAMTSTSADGAQWQPVSTVAARVVQDAARKMAARASEKEGAK